MADGPYDTPRVALESLTDSRVLERVGVEVLARRGYPGMVLTESSGDLGRDGYVPEVHGGRDRVVMLASTESGWAGKLDRDLAPHLSRERALRPDVVVFVTTRRPREIDIEPRRTRALAAGVELDVWGQSRLALELERDDLRPVAERELRVRPATPDALQGVETFRERFGRSVPGFHADLVGREVETAALRTVLVEATADEPAPVVLVVGAPGVGKTRLAVDVAYHHAATVVLPSSLPLRSVDLDRVPRDGPAVLVIDDAHLAPDLSGLTAMLFDACYDRVAVVLVTSSDDEQEVVPHLGIAGRRIHRMRLDPLTDQDIDRIVRAYDDTDEPFRTRVIQAAQGVPRIAHRACAERATPDGGHPIGLAEILRELGDGRREHDDARVPGREDLRRATRSSAGTSTVSHGRVDDGGALPLATDAVRWPVTVGRAPRAVTGGIDRRARLEEALAERMPVVLVGGAGVGKSVLAAQEFRARNPQVALWVAATSRSAVLTAYSSAAAQLRLDREDDEATATRLLGWLSRTDQPWAVVLDDVGDIEDVHDLIPEGPAGLAVVTTQWSTAAVDAAASRIDVGAYESEESVRFLRGRFARKARRLLDGADELAQELGHLPLALAHAAAVIVDDGLSCREYLEELRSRQSTIAELMPGSPREIGSDYPVPVALAWRMALERANARAPAGLARPLWEVVSCLDPHGIPDALLLSEPVRARLAGPDAAPVSVNRAKKALSNLSALSLVQRSRDHSDVQTHVLAQRVSRESLGSDDLRDAGRTAAESLVAVWPAEIPARVEVDTLASNVDRLREVCPEPLWHPEAHVVLFGRGRIVGRSGRALSAARYFADLVR